MRRLLVVFLLILFALIGCATSNYTVGKDFDSTLVKKIEKGKTTSDDLFQMFGYPFSKTVVTENEEKWIYMYSSGTAKAQSYIITTKASTTGQQKMLDILIKDGVVINFTYNEGPMPSTIEVR